MPMRLTSRVVPGNHVMRNFRPILPVNPYSFDKLFVLVLRPIVFLVDFDHYLEQISAYNRWISLYSLYKFLSMGTALLLVSRSDEFCDFCPVLTMNSHSCYEFFLLVFSP